MRKPLNVLITGLLVGTLSFSTMAKSAQQSSIENTVKQYSTINSELIELFNCEIPLGLNFSMPYGESEFYDVSLLSYDSVSKTITVGPTLKQVLEGIHGSRDISRLPQKPWEV